MRSLIASPRMVVRDLWRHMEKFAFNIFGYRVPAMMNISTMCGVCSLGIAVVAVSPGQMLVINVHVSLQRPRVDKVRFSFLPANFGRAPGVNATGPPAQSSLEIPSQLKIEKSMHQTYRCTLILNYRYQSLTEKKLN